MSLGGVSSKQMRHLISLIIMYSWERKKANVQKRGSFFLPLASGMFQLEWTWRVADTIVSSMVMEDDCDEDTMAYETYHEPCMCRTNDRLDMCLGITIRMRGVEMPTYVSCVRTARRIYNEEAVVFQLPDPFDHPRADSTFDARIECWGGDMYVYPTRAYETRVKQTLTTLLMDTATYIKDVLQYACGIPLVLVTLIHQFVAWNSFLVGRSLDSFA